MRDRYDSRGRGGGGGYAPVKVGDEIEVSIEAVGAKGDGIAKKDGFVLFIPGVNEGDEVHIKITKVLRRVGFAEVVGSASGETKEETSEETEEAPAEESQEETEEQPAEEEPEATEDSEDFGEEDK